MASATSSGVSEIGTTAVAAGTSPCDTTCRPDLPDSSVAPTATPVRVVRAIESGPPRPTNEGAPSALQRVRDGLGSLYHRHFWIEFTDAGAVVTRDVAPGAVVTGVPARRWGWNYGPSTAISSAGR